MRLHANIEVTSLEMPFLAKMDILVKDFVLIIKKKMPHPSL